MPRSLQAASNGVGRRVMRMSNTAACGDTRSTGNGIGSCSCSPSGVACTTRSKPAGSQRPATDTAKPVRIDVRTARLFARSVLASKTVRDASVRRASALAIARPAPPAPTSSTRRPVTSTPWCCSAETNPAPSNNAPSREPSAQRRTALTDPAASAVSSTRSSRPITDVLCGMETNSPLKLGTAMLSLTKAPNRAALARAGTTMASMPARSNRRLNNRGAFTCATGSATTRKTSLVP
jgi:hypothetical protein